MIDIRHGDCIEVMRAMDDACVDAIVTDPPYELGFMGKGWDSTGIANSVEMWREAFRVLKPGGHLLAMGGTRTFHRMVCAIEDAGFEVRDQIGWLYGSGFPKSLNVSVAIDKAAGAEREVIGDDPWGAGRKPRPQVGDAKKSQLSGGDLGAHPGITAPATPEAQQWAGWGTALKPAMELICVARKPLSEKTVAANVLQHGTGAINIGATRVDGKRWPANIIHDGSPEVLEAFAAFGTKTSGGSVHGGDHYSDAGYEHGIGKTRTAFSAHADKSGTAARFFYSAKASKADRAGSKHPTVKPISLMRYLCKLVTPPGGTVLDMFAGSGTTLQAAMEEGFSAIGIEQSEEYVTDIRNRISAAREGLGLFSVAAE